MYRYMDPGVQIYELTVSFNLKNIDKHWKAFHTLLKIILTY